MARTITTTATFVRLGDSVVARFLRDGDLVVAKGGRHFEVTTGVAAVNTISGDVSFGAVNELGGIEVLTFGRDEFVPLLTAV